MSNQSDWREVWKPRGKNETADKLRSAIFEDPKGEPPSLLIEWEPLAEVIRALESSPSAQEIVSRFAKELRQAKRDYFGENYGPITPFDVVAVHMEKFAQGKEKESR